MEREKELEEGLIGLMYALGISKVRMMLSLALIRAHHLHEEMVMWIASYHGTDRTMTAQDFMSTLRRLSETQDCGKARFGEYYNHPERYGKHKKANHDELQD